MQPDLQEPELAAWLAAPLAIAPSAPTQPPPLARVFITFESADRVTIRAEFAGRGNAWCVAATIEHALGRQLPQILGELQQQIRDAMGARTAPDSGAT